MRTPSELLKCFLSSGEDIDSFLKSLSYEEVNVVIMITELLLKNPSIDRNTADTYETALSFFKEIRKGFIERN